MNDRIRTIGRTRRALTAVTLAALTAGSGVAAYADVPDGASAASTGVQACRPLPADSEPPQLPDPTPTTTATLRQAYECILDNAYAGSRVDTRELLRAGFKAFTEELIRRGADRPEATLAGLTGRRDRDWKAFAATYQRVTDALPQDADLRQALAGAVINGMLSALHDNHVRWDGFRPGGGGGGPFSLGFLESASGRFTPQFADAAPPLYVKLVKAGGPADLAGLKPGDVLVAVNGVPVEVNGRITTGVMEWLHPKSDRDAVKVTVKRPSTDETLSVDLRPYRRTPALPAVAVTLLPGNVAGVTLPAMLPGFADEALAKIAELRRTTGLRGIVFDVRGNGGGRAEEGLKLISSFAHGKVVGRDCDVRNHCTETRTDDTVALLDLPYAVVTDSMCASACEDFVANTKFLGLGKVVGTRTMGAVSGLQNGFQLNDNSVLIMPTTRHHWANGEVVDEIGVPVDHPAERTAEDLSDGRDPALDKALSLLAS
ncbi:S41 family peptidase [Kitasatospora sp. NPDC056184]|uniref:S41 family peptidase n=1 Tax=Kitasatospora sp. NPDC056184 TaxID=3345738 RepID=UPI0035D739FB